MVEFFRNFIICFYLNNQTTSISATIFRTLSYDSIREFTTQSDTGTPTPEKLAFCNSEGVPAYTNFVGGVGMSKSQESKQSSDTKVLLYDWIVSEKKCITVPYLTRHAQILSNKAVKLMEEFYKEHDDKGLSAVYAILAQTVSKCGSNDICKQITLAKEYELDSVRSKFDAVISTNIYSLQINPIDDLKLLTNVDWDDVSIEEKQLARIEDQRISRENSAEPSTSKPTQKSVVRDNKNKKIDAMFGTGKKKSPKTSMPANQQKINFVKQEAETTTSPKKRRPKIIIDGVNSDSEPLKKTPTKKTPEKSKDFNEFVNQSNDLFCTEESPEKASIDFMDISESIEDSKDKSRHRKDSSKKLNISEKDEVMEIDKVPLNTKRLPVDDLIEPRRIIRHAKAPETFVDEDGFLVTSQVNKIIETDEIAPQTKRQVLQPKPSNVTPTEKKKGKGASHSSQGQTKLSNFFAKK